MIFFMLLTISCTRIEQASTQIFDVSTDTINLPLDIKSDWDKFCVITPYSTEKYASEILGIDFVVMDKSNISVAENITLLVFMNKNDVIQYFETPRNNVDFTSLGARCFKKSEAKFNIMRDANGWTYLERT